mmetsp:Transcript_20747/g.51882  ORF Transcript_20747/g.51882 Transcript_20747/m.51882 type:complete len:237 (+) Transcript_20747:718-1428(+)
MPWNPTASPATIPPGRTRQTPGSPCHCRPDASASLLLLLQGLLKPPPTHPFCPTFSCCSPLHAPRPWQRHPSALRPPRQKSRRSRCRRQQPLQRRTWALARAASGRRPPQQRHPQPTFLKATHEAKGAPRLSPPSLPSGHEGLEESQSGAPPMGAANENPLLPGNPPARPRSLGGLPSALLGPHRTPLWKRTRRNRLGWHTGTSPPAPAGVLQLQQGRRTRTSCWMPCSPRPTPSD